MQISNVKFINPSLHATIKEKAEPFLLMVIMFLVLIWMAMD